MKKNMSLLRKLMNNPFSFALLSNLITLFVGCYIFRPFFEENDDLGMAMIAEGAFGQRDYHLVYSNALLGKIVTALCSAVTGVRWFVVLELTFAFIAFVLVTYVFAHYHNGKYIAIITEIACVYEIYVSIQYTKISTFIGVCALIALFDWVNRKFLQKKGTEIEFSRSSDIVVPIIAAVSIICSALLRESAFLIAFGVVLITWGIDVLLNNRSVNMAKKLAVVLCTLLPILVVNGLLILGDNALYSDENWSYYRYYDELRRGMVDFHYDALDYTRYEDELTKLNVSENDALMYVTWQFADEKIVTPELMNQIIAITSHRSVNIDVIKAFIANVYSTLLRFEPIILLALIAIALIMQRSGIASSSWIHLVAQALLYAFCIFYYQISGRWNKRVVFASMIAMTVTLLYSCLSYDSNGYISPINRRSKNTYDFAEGSLIVLTLLIVSLIGMRLNNEFEYQENLRQKETRNFSVLQMYLEEEKDKLFVADTISTSEMYRYDVFSSISEGALDNYVTCGSWMTETPIEKEILDSYGYFDAFDALRNGGDDVVLIDNCYPDKKAIFLTEHGDGPRYTAEYIESVCGYDMYRIR